MAFKKAMEILCERNDMDDILQLSLHFILTCVIYAGCPRQLTADL